MGTIITHADRPVVDLAPGVRRRVIVSRDTGAGSLTTSWVEVDPGARSPVHYHKVEEAMLIVGGEGIAIKGDEQVPIRAGQTFLSPAGEKHGFINTGREPLLVTGIFPTVDVEIIPAD